VDFALVPVENSQGGSILETYDLLLEYRALVVAEVALQGWALVDQELEEGLRSVAAPTARGFPMR